MPRRFNEGSGPSQRQLRVAEMIRRALAEVLSQRTPADPELPQMSITVSEVRLSSDLKRALVYVLPLGGDRASEAVEALNRERAEIRRALNRSVYLKYSPRLEFTLDTAFDRMDEVKRLLEREEVRRDLDSQAAQESGIG